MTKLYVNEYASYSATRRGDSGVFQDPPLATQALTISTVTSSNAFNALTHYVEMFAEAACHVKFGTAPTAVAGTDMLLSAGSRVVRRVTPGQKVSVIATS